MSGQPYLDLTDGFRVVETEKPIRKLSEPVRVVRLPDPALGRLIALRGQGYGWEDICVLMQREGILVSKSDVRRFILGPQCTTASRGKTGGRFSACRGRGNPTQN